MNSGSLPIGKRMPGILRRAGFNEIDITPACTVQKGEAEVAEHARTLGRLFEPGGPLRTRAIERGWADEAQLDRIATAWRAWGADRDAFVAFVMARSWRAKVEPLAGPAGQGRGRV